MCYFKESEFNRICRQLSLLIDSCEENSLCYLQIALKWNHSRDDNLQKEEKDIIKVIEEIPCIFHIFEILFASYHMFQNMKGIKHLEN